MLFVSLSSFRSIQGISSLEVDGLELRLDLWNRIEQSEISQILKESCLPVMCTLRRSSHGGFFKGSEEIREAKILEILRLKPPFFDLEYDMRSSFLKAVLQDFPETKYILSYHNFEGTPKDLESIFLSMARYPAFAYKIAALSQSASDALRMLLLGRKHPKLSVICMGERGAFARVLGPVAGNPIDYACLDASSKTAPFQLTASEMIQTYRYPMLNKDTAVFGLIGDPVASSQGHLYHNRVFADRKHNAVYVKMIVPPDELSLFFPLASAFGFQGLSVTMPLKEAVLPFLRLKDSSVQAIGAANTLYAQNPSDWMATNTDGKGALDAIESRMAVRGKVVVLIGAGGAARAIAYEAIQRGAAVWILNRTKQRAKEVADQLGCYFGSLADIPLSYDIIVSCSPDPMGLDWRKVKQGTLAMDIVYQPKKTPFLERAQSLSCEVIYGEEMFLNQARRQTSFWLL